MNKKIEKQIGANIRALRERAGMTQDVLAAKLQLAGCDMTRSAVAKIEVGQRHQCPDEILLIKEILGVSFEDIFSVSNIFHDGFTLICGRCKCWIHAFP